MRQTDRQEQTEKHYTRETDRQEQTEKHYTRETDRQKQRENHYTRETDRQTDRQTKTEKQRQREKYLIESPNVMKEENNARLHNYSLVRLTTQVTTGSLRRSLHGPLHASL